MPDIRTTISSAKDALKKKGLLYTIKSGIDYVLLPKIYDWYYRTFHSSNMFTNDTFEFQGKLYNYYYHRYERTVEIPIAWDLLKQYRGKTILEIGNVLGWYFDVNHDVLDKYEHAKGVINEDIVDFEPGNKYDLIVSISTIEHVGWDEVPRDPEKLLKALTKIEQLLKSGGKALVTVPVGYNSFLDDSLERGKLPFNQQYYLMRTKKNKWHEVNWDAIKMCKYGEPFPAANGLVVGIIQK